MVLRSFCPHSDYLSQEEETFVDMLALLNALTLLALS